MRTHVMVLGWIHLIVNGLGLLAGALMLLAFLGFGGLGLAAGGSDGLPFLGAMGVIGTMIMVIIAVFSLPGFLVGLGLLNLAPWSRIGAIIISVIQLFNFPIGTAIGIYGLVVMCNEETIALFNRYGSY